MLEKINGLILYVMIAIGTIFFIGANGAWRSDPSILSASIRLFSVFPFAGALTLWFMSKKSFDRKVVLVCTVSMVVGMILNSIAILANDGRMPIDPSFEAAGFPKYYVNGGNMLWLGDSLWMGNSIGDCFVYLAMIVLCYLLIKYSIEGVKEMLKK
jgi:hypothetical protein